MPRMSVPATRSPSEALFACSSYGLGRVAMIGDSSPPDDGTGDTADTLFNGWFAEAGGDHADIIINACLWLNPAPQPPACPADINADELVVSPFFKYTAKFGKVRWTGQLNVDNAFNNVTNQGRIARYPRYTDPRLITLTNSFRF